MCSLCCQKFVPKIYICDFQQQDVLEERGHCGSYSSLQAWYFWRDLLTRRKSDLLWYNIFNLFSVFLQCSSKFLHINMKRHPLSLPSLHSWPCKNQNTELELLCSYNRAVENSTEVCMRACTCKSKSTLCKLCTLRQEKYWHCFRFLAAAHWCLIYQLLLPSTEEPMPGFPVGLRTMRRFLGTHILWLPAESLDNDLP